MEPVLITVADFKRLLKEAEVTIDDPSALIVPKKRDRSYQSRSPKSALLMLSDTKSGGKTFRVHLTMQYEKHEYAVVVDHRAQEAFTLTERHRWTSTDRRAIFTIDQHFGGFMSVRSSATPAVRTLYEPLSKP